MLPEPGRMVSTTAERFSLSLSLVAACGTCVWAMALQFSKPPAMFATMAATAVATTTAISSSSLLRISSSSSSSSSSVATTIHLLKCSSFVGGNPVCCPQINREGNNNNCWQSVSSVVGGVNVRCSTSSSDRRVGFLGRLGRVFKEKAKSDIQLLFSGFSKTRENLAVVDELLTYWNLSDSENILDELEEVQCFSFLCCFFSSLARLQAAAAAAYVAAHLGRKFFAQLKNT